MRYTYIASDNTSSNGNNLGADNQDVVVYKIIFGSPTASQYATVFDKYNPVYDSTTNIAAKITQPGTLQAGSDGIVEVDFGPGLWLGEGGNVVTDASQVTVIWDYAPNQ